MEIKVGSDNVALLVKMRLNGAVITLAEHKALYNWIGGDDLEYSLEFDSADKTKTGSVNYDPALSTADGLYFSIPATLLDTPQIVYAVSLKFRLKLTTDFGLYKFEVKVTNPTSQNTR